MLSAGSDILSSLVSTNLLSPTDFREQMREEIKREYIRQYLAGIGGREQMTPADWGSIGGMLSEQYRFLDGFIEAIPDLTEGQIKNRARMYINSAREGYERANSRAMEKAGMTEVAWVLNAPAEHCADCVEFDGMGWTEIEDDAYGGAMPGSGDTICLTSCQCHLEYR